MHENKSNNKKILLVIIIGIVIVCAIFLLLFVDFKDYSKWNNVSETKHALNIYEDDGLLYFESVLTENDKYNSYIRFTYYCKNKNCEGKFIIDDAPYAIIKDGNNNLIYNYSNNTYRYLKIEDSLENVDILYYENNLYGIVVGDSDNKYKVYSFDTNSFITDSKYSDYENNSAAFVHNEFVGVYNISGGNANYEVINLSNGNIDFTIVGAYTSGIKLSSNGNFYLLPRAENGSVVYDLYNSNFILLKTIKYEYLEIVNGNAVIKTSKNEFATIDNNGSVVKKSNYYNEVIMLCKDYVFVVDSDNYIKLVDYNDKFIARITEYVSSYYFHTESSGWYKDDNGKELLYLVVEDMDFYDEMIGKSIEFSYNPITKVVDKQYLDSVAVEYKPIIYLYPEYDNTKVTVNFEKPKLLLISYPKYNNGWNVIANKNGDLYDSNGKYYYGLYFEEKNNDNIEFKEGFYVTKDNAIEFLEDKLSIIGLNDREKDEFIMYWLPILAKNEKNIVYFEFTSSKERHNKLIITPEPDSMLRLSIHIKKVDKKVNIKEQKLETFKRHGFTVVEWGGINHK